MKFLFFVFLLSIPTAVLAVCNDGDFYHDGYCYTIPVFNDNYGMSHSDGQSYCRQRGANLPVLHTSEQEGFHVTMLIRVFGKGYSWIGLNNPGKWDDGSNVDYTNWDQQYPTNKSNCVIEYYNHRNTNEGFWRDDYDCTFKSKFFCQYPINPIPTTAAPPSPSCNHYDISVGNRCYTFFDQVDLSRSKAAEYCQQYNQTLAIFDNIHQVNTVQDHASHMFINNFWIGLYFNSVDQQYYWPGNLSLTFDNFGLDQHLNKTEYPAVIQSIYPGVNNGKWLQAVSESYLYNFVCSGYSDYLS